MAHPPSAWEVFRQTNGDVTKAYYELLNSKSVDGQLGVALFRAQKRSTAAKNYRGRRFKSAAYDVKNWSLGEICRVLTEFALPYRWGWKRDPNTPGYEQVLYVELPTGQCSFHSATRLDGPEFEGEWSGVHNSTEVILAFCDLAMTGAV
jgi:hypothetical protein